MQCVTWLHLCIEAIEATQINRDFFQTQSERRNATPKNFDSIMLMLIVNDKKIRRLIFSLDLNSYLAAKSL